MVVGVGGEGKNTLNFTNWMRRGHGNAKRYCQVDGTAKPEAGIDFAVAAAEDCQQATDTPLLPLCQIFQMLANKSWRNDSRIQLRVSWLSLIHKSHAPPFTSRAPAVEES